MGEGDESRGGLLHRCDVEPTDGGEINKLMFGRTINMSTQDFKKKGKVTHNEGEQPWLVPFFPAITSFVSKMDILTSQTKEKNRLCDSLK